MSFPSLGLGRRAALVGEVRCTSVVFVGIHAGVGVGSVFMAGWQLLFGIGILNSKSTSECTVPSLKCL